MGQEARCLASYGPLSGEGRLQHEGVKLMFRGAFRLDIPVAELTKAEARGDDLVLTWGGGGRDSASFSLGAAAAGKWAHKILHPPGLLDKLGIKTGTRVAVKGTFPPAFLVELSSRVKPSLVRGAQTYDVVLLAAHKPADLDAIGPLIPRLTLAGALWVVYPKGVATIKEAQVREAGQAAALVDNKTCAFSATLTAFRWVRPRAAR